MSRNFLKMGFLFIMGMFVLFSCTSGTEETKQDILAGTIWIAPAGPGMSITFEFKENQALTVTDPGGSHGMEYTLDGDTIRLSDGSEYYLSADGKEITGSMTSSHPGASSVNLTFKKQ